MTKNSRYVNENFKWVMKTLKKVRKKSVKRFKVNEKELKIMERHKIKEKKLSEWNLKVGLGNIKKLNERQDRQI